MMRPARDRWMRPITILVGFAVLAAACGQLPGATGSGAAGAPGTLEERVLTGDSLDGGEGLASEGTDTSGPLGATRAGGTRGGTGTAGVPGAVAGAGDRTGIYEDRIVIGIHAPVTGAAPVTSQAFVSGRDLYWRWLKQKGESVFGKDVVVKFEDDTYSPSVAARRCQEMAEREPKAFLLVGGAGTDQIAACARYAAAKGIPYLSAGVTEESLRPYRTYFAISASYRAQGPILAQMLVKKFGTQALDVMSPGGIRAPDGQLRIAMVRADTANFDDAEAGFREGLERSGFNMSNFYVYNLPKEDSPTLRSAIAAAIQSMAQNGIDVVNTLIAPVVVIELVQEADSRGYRPKYVAIGVTTVNQVSNVLCQSAPQSYNGASVFFPWPGWPEVMQGKFDPEFREAANKFEDARSVNTVSGGGDIVLALWSLSKILHEMFNIAGPAMTRQSFVASLEAGGVISTGLYPDLQYAPSRGGHFGTRSVFRTEAECQTDRAFHYREGPLSGY